MGATSSPSHLEQEVEQLVRLRELLDAEKRALERFDSEGLLQAAHEKARTASLLRNLRAKRAGPGSDGNATSAEPQARELFGRRNALLREIRERSQALQVALDEQARMAERLLSFLRGLRLGSRLYDSRGRMSVP